MVNKIIWKSIDGFDKYRISNKGDVKSFYGVLPRILKPKTDRYGYFGVRLIKDGKGKSFRPHMLVAMAFLGHIPDGTNKLVVNHINLNKKDNRVENLEIISHRENTNLKHIKHSSQYTGVSFEKSTNKWRAVIYLNHKWINIGRYKSEIDAHNAYQGKLAG